MTSSGVMPHPWWQFWQIADFLIMAAVVVFFVRYVRRSDARPDPWSEAEEAEPSAPDGPEAAPAAQRDAKDDAAGS